MNLTDIRCGQCGRKLAAGRYIEISIKCPRCGTLNHLRATEPLTSAARLPVESQHGTQQDAG